MLVQTARSNLPTPYRAWAAARLLLLSEKVDAETKLPEDVRGCLVPDLMTEWLIPPDGIPTTLGTLLQQFLGHGTAISAMTGNPAQAEDQDPTAISELNPDATIRRTLRVPKGSAPTNLAIWNKMPPTNLLDRYIRVADGPLSPMGMKLDTMPSLSSLTLRETRDGFIVVGPFTIAFVRCRGDLQCGCFTSRSRIHYRVAPASTGCTRTE